MFFNEYVTDIERHLSALFVAGMNLIVLYKAHPEITLVDCTYKTNRCNIHS